MSLIIEETIQINNVRMVQKRLNFKLAGKLLENVVLNDFLFFHHLHSHDKPSCYLPYHIDLSKLAFS